MTLPEPYESPREDIARALRLADEYRQAALIHRDSARDYERSARRWRLWARIATATNFAGAAWFAWRSFS